MQNFGLQYYDSKLGSRSSRGSRGLRVRISPFRQSHDHASAKRLVARFAELPRLQGLIARCALHDRAKDLGPHWDGVSMR